MTNRTMYDAIGSNASGLQQFNPQMVAGYDTGSSGIQWTAADFALFPGIPHVHIDQAGSGAPIYSANVMDVETNAYVPGDIPGWMAHATAPRPTVYCNRSELSQVLAVWSGPIWLAFPGWQPGQSLPSPQIIAVQNNFQSAYDSSVVLDPAWPDKETKMLHGMIQPNGVQEFVPFPSGDFSEVFLYHDFTPAGASYPVRIGIHSVSGGYLPIVNHNVTHSVPESVTWTATDVDGVSLVNNSTVPIGWTLA